MTAMLDRTKCSLIELSFENLEMADDFGVFEEEMTGYTFPMSIPYISEMQEQEKIKRIK
jgi:hypothetical protein